MEHKKLTSDKPWFITINLSKESKEAKCSCGNSWTPVDINDTECFSCSNKEDRGSSS